MLCERCQAHAAKVFLTQIVNGQIQKIDLCEHCARELGVTQNTPFSLPDLLVKSAALAQAQTVPESDLEECPACGRTLGDVRKQGWLGCPECYRSFHAYLAEMIQTTQKAPRHVGKVPVCARVEQARATRKDLEEAIEQAVRAENYEEAARLRDHLRLLAG